MRSNGINKTFTIAFVGQPNVGKSQLLNTLSGSNLKVGNFAGVTVEKFEASLVHQGYALNFIDLPGLYSLNSYAKDEAVTKEFLVQENYDLIVNVVDSTNLERNLYLTSELMALGKKMVIALNMDDEAQKEGIDINSEYLSTILHIPCIKISSIKKTNLNKLLDRMVAALKFDYEPNKLKFSDDTESKLMELGDAITNAHLPLGNIGIREAAILFVTKDKTFYNQVHSEPAMMLLTPIIAQTINDIKSLTDNDSIEEALLDEYHAFARGAALESQKIVHHKNYTLTEKIDNILIHPFFGIPIFLFFMWLLFQATFSLGELPMGYIESAFALLGESVASHLQNENMKSIIVDAIIGGVGTVILFLPNIIILFFGIALLETTGYMARVSFLLDGFFHKFGLHGKSFIPLVTGFGCSIPAYMAARTLKSHKDRLLTMFIIGFMSCGARLPVYVLFVGAFFSQEVAGNVLFAIYISGAFLGLIAAKILRLTVFKGSDEPFVMEMPKYRLPSPKLIWFTIYSKSVMYLKKAGTFILAASILVWFISTYPKNELIENEYTTKIEQAQNDTTKTLLENEKNKLLMENTYLGMAGKTIEPIFAPLGFDWKMSVATVSGLAAKEVIVSTLGVLYSLGSDISEEDASLQTIIAKEIPFASGVAFIVFVMIYLPCLAATAVFSKEAGNRKYTWYLVIFTFSTAWILAFLAFHITTWIS